MSRLSNRDTELVALGAAVGSNCVPCVRYHIREARDAGLTDDDIARAIETASEVKQVPATLVLNAARNELGGIPTEPKEPVAAQEGCGCQAKT